MSQLWAQPEAKDEILTRIVNGDALGALGFSEPASGSGVFSARFSAVRDSDGWVMNGQKMFTTNGHNAEYILMLTRTDTSGKKHQGLTMFIMPLNLPGVEIHPVYTRSEEHTSELQSLMRISYAVFCLKKQKKKTITKHNNK